MAFLTALRRPCRESVTANVVFDPGWIEREANFVEAPQQPITRLISSNESPLFQTRNTCSTTPVLAAAPKSTFARHPVKALWA
jgi:hypothetical protein